MSEEKIVHGRVPVRYQENHLRLFDTTFRDGEQSPITNEVQKYSKSYEEKRVLLNGMLALGIRDFEFFSPVVGKHEWGDLLRLKEEFNSQYTDINWYIHARCMTGDIEQALDEGFNHFNLYMAVNDRSANGSYGKDRQQVIAHVRKTVEEIRSYHPSIYLRYSVEDAFRTTLDEMREVFDVVSESVNTLGIPDTVGEATPKSAAQLVEALLDLYPNNDLEGHNHDDAGLSLAVSLAEIESGLPIISVSVLGVAERSGITSETALLFNIDKHFPHLSRQYNLEECYPLNVLMASILGIPVPFKEPVSLTNRSHSAGVHTSAILTDHTIYEAHNLKRFGVDKQQLLVGRLSGWHMISYYLEQVEYFIITSQQAKEITNEFKDRVYKLNGSKSAEQLLVEIAQTYGLQRKPEYETAKKVTVERLD